MRVVVVPEFDDEWMAFEERLHDAALHAASAAVHEPDLRQSGVARSTMSPNSSGEVRRPCARTV